MKKNIIIVDDHHMFLEGLISVLSTQENYNILFASDNAKNVIKYLRINRSAQVDIIISNINMSDMNGIQLNREIKKQFPLVKTLIMSSHKNTKLYTLIKNQGADGYIPKNVEKNELLKAIKNILKGQKYFSESITRTYIRSKDTDLSAIMDSLTNRERDILCLISKEYATKDIADTLCLSKHTINSYRKNMMIKLGTRNVVGLAVWSLKLGLDNHCIKR